MSASWRQGGRTSRTLFSASGFLTLQVIMLVALQVTATALLWFLNPITQAETHLFALYLSVDMVSFAILSYMYRVSKQGRQPSQSWLAFGYLSIVVLLSSHLLGA